MNAFKCGNCYQPIDITRQEDFQLQSAAVKQATYYLCSIACVCELAWKLREAQPKLSKSRTE